jgi:PAS domain S-box-containing protein
MIHFLYENSPYVLTPLAIQTLIVGLGLIGLGVYGLVREQGSHVSMVYFALTSAMGLWLFAFSWMYSAIDEALAMWWARVAYVGIASIPAAVYHFSALILNEYESSRKRVLASWALSMCFIVMILTTDLQFASLYRYSWGFYPRSRITSIPFIVYFFVIMILTMRSVAAAYRTSARGTAPWLRARTLLLGFSSGYFGTIDFVSSFGIPWRPLGYVGIFFFLVISAWSISRYRFMTITPAFAAHQIIDTMNDALIVLDRDGIVRLVNRAMCRLFGCREQEVVGMRPSEGMVGSTAFARELETLVKSGSIRDREMEFRDQGNDVRILSLSASIMRNPVDEQLATVCVVSDISERKRAEQEREGLIARLEELNRQLQAIDKMKSDFVSIVSHELRTPLTTVKAFAELILMKPDMPLKERSKFMGIINAEADRLSRLISDILDLSRIESGSMKWRVEDLSIEEVIQNSLSSMGPLFEKKGLAVKTTLDPFLPRFPGDRDRLVQVVTNIFSNAVKFTPCGGSVHITARWESSPKDQVVVEIADTGVGISAEDLEPIFERFQRSTHGRAGEVEGTGLGLAIARQIIEHHGGRIWAESMQEKGSTFIFILPLVRDVPAGSLQK